MLSDSYCPPNFYDKTWNIAKKKKSLTLNLDEVYCSKFLLKKVKHDIFWWQINSFKNAALLHVINWVFMGGPTPTPKSIHWNPNPQCDGIRRKGHGRLGYVGGALLNGISALLTGSQRVINSMIAIPSWSTSHRGNSWNLLQLLSFSCSSYQIYIQDLPNICF